MKVCSMCGASKSEENFFYRSKRNSKLHAQCKECYVVKRRQTWRAHYYKYGSKYRDRAVERNRRLKLGLRIKLLDFLKDKSCESCGIKDPRVLEFDHIHPETKSFEIAKGIHGMLSWPNILAEIEKCQILCANCHKIRTAEQQQWFKNEALLDNKQV